MHLALVCPDLHGHLNPMLTLGRELRRRGHRLTLVAFPDAAPKAAKADIPFAPIGVKEHAAGEVAAGLKQLSELTGFAALKLTGRLLKDQTAVGLRDLPGVLRDVKADAVVVDQVSPHGGAVAEALGLPFAVACNALAVQQEAAVPPPTLPWNHWPGPLGRMRNRLGNALLGVAARPITAEVNAYRRAHRLPHFRLSRTDGYGLVQVAQQPAFFDFPRRYLSSHFHFTGPWHEPARDAGVTFPWEKLDGRPLVYASLGTLQNRLKHVFRAILDGCSGLGVQVVLSLGRADAAWDGPVPGNAVVVPFAPQLELLSKSAMAVTHAGLNTALEGIARGLPLLCIPVTNDQPGVAARVRHLGAGEVVRPKHATADRVRAAVQRLLDDAKYRTAAEGLAARMRGGPGVADAAAVVERALTTGRRVDRW